MEEEIIGKVVGKYPFNSPVQPQSGVMVIQQLIPRICYQINAKGKIYSLDTLPSCDIPIGAEVKIKRKGRFFAETFLCYENNQFTASNLL